MTEASEPVSEMPPPERPSRRRWAIAAIALIVLVTAGVFAADLASMGPHGRV